MGSRALLAGALLLLLRADGALQDSAEHPVKRTLAKIVENASIENPPNETSVVTDSDKDAASQDLADDAVRHQEAKLISAVVKMQEHCGVIGSVDNEKGEVIPHSGKLTSKDCHTSLLTNCTVSYWPIQCPAECQFVVEDPAVSCFFKCVTEDSCSEEDPDVPFPDKEDWMCAPCNVTLCKRCSTASKCAECHSGFEMSPDGTSCTLELNITWLTIIVQVLGAVVVLVVMLAIVWSCSHGGHERAAEHMVCVRRARLHRHLCKTAMWQLDSRHQVRQWVTLAENVHTQNIVGVGLPLFYNSLCFLMLVALITFGFTFYLHHWNLIEWAVAGASSGVKVMEFVEKHQGRKTIFEDDKVEMPGRRPALVVSRLKQCGQHDAEEDNEELMNMADRTFFMVIALYVVLFLLSLWFGKFQKKQTLEFDSQHPTMSDYAMRVEGLPTDETDEAKIRLKLEEMFRKELPEEMPRPPQHQYGKSRKDKDTMVPRPPTQIEVFAVSLAYNYTEKRQTVDDAIWKLIEVQEVELFQEAKNHELNKEWLEMTYEDQELRMSDTSFVNPADDATKNITTTEAHKLIKGKVSGFFEEGPDKMKTIGEAYIVFKYIADKEKIADHVEKNPNAFRWTDGDKELPLSFHPVFGEPTSVTWWSAGLSKGQITKNMFRALGIITFLILFLELCINLPYYWFVQRPYREAGAIATGLVTNVYGIIVGNVNGLIFWGIYMIGEGIGFHRKDSLYRFVCVTSVIFVTILTSATIFLMAKLVTEKYNHTSAGAMFFVSIKYLGIEIAFSETIFNMLPGLMFGGAVGKFLNPQFMYMWFQLLMKILYVWRCLPDAVLNVLKAFLPYKPETLEHYPFRNAEKGVDPWEIPFFSDYADWVVLPSVCFLNLMFMSTFVWRAFRMLAIWAVFIYFYFRYMHLRYHRINFYSTNRLNNIGMYTWGLALSSLAVQIPLWGFRAGYLPQDWLMWEKMQLLILAFIVSFGLWTVSYHFLIQPWVRQDVKEENNNWTVQEVKMKFVYSWLNTNPVFVLKCRYFFQDIDGKDTGHRGEKEHRHPIACGEDEDEVRFFEVGKEYLFIRPERQHLLKRSLKDFMEPEYWIDRASWRFGQCAQMCRTEMNSKRRELTGSTYKQLSASPGSTEPLIDKGEPTAGPPGDVEMATADKPAE